VCAGNELVADVPEGVFDGAEDFVVGKIDQFVGESLEGGLGFGAEGVKDELASCFSIL
jgi:hypothetical protein